MKKISCSLMAFLFVAGSVLAQGEAAARPGLLTVQLALIPKAQVVIIGDPIYQTTDNFLQNVADNFTFPVGTASVVVSSAAQANAYINLQWIAAGSPEGGIDVVIIAWGSTGIESDRGFWLGEDWITHNNAGEQALVQGLQGEVNSITILAGYLAKDYDRETMHQIGRDLQRNHQVTVQAYDGPIFYEGAYQRTQSGWYNGDARYPLPHLIVWKDTNLIVVTVD